MSVSSFKLIRATGSNHRMSQSLMSAVAHKRHSEVLTGRNEWLPTAGEMFNLPCWIKLMCQVLPHNPWLMVVLLWWPVCFCSPFSFLSFLFWCSLPVVVSVSLMQVFWLNLIYLFYYRPMLSETFIGIYKHVQCIFCFSQNKICIFNHMTHPLSTVIQIIK